MIMSESAAFYHDKLSQTKLDLIKAQDEISKYERGPPDSDSANRLEVVQDLPQEDGDSLHTNFDLVIENLNRSISAMNQNNEELKNSLDKVKNLAKSLKQRDLYLSDDILGSISVIGDADRDDESKLLKLQDNLGMMKEHLARGKSDSAAFDTELNNALNTQTRLAIIGRRITQTLRDQRSTKKQGAENR